MGLFAFLFKSPIGIVISLFSGVIGIAVVGVVVVGALAIAGGPGPCTPGGAAIEDSDAHAQTFDTKWDEMDGALDGGTATSITLTESEVTSRANKYIDSKGGDLADVQVCIHDGFGEVSGKANLPVGTAKFKVKGTVDLSGEHPAVTFQDIEVGSVPGFVTGPLEGIVEDAMKELLNDVDLSHTYAPTLAEGQVHISGTP